MAGPVPVEVVVVTRVPVTVAPNRGHDRRFDHRLDGMRLVQVIKSLWVDLTLVFWFELLGELLHKDVGNEFRLFGRQLRLGGATLLWLMIVTARPD